MIFIIPLAIINSFQLNGNVFGFSDNRFESSDLLDNYIEYIHVMTIRSEFGWFAS